MRACLTSGQIKLYEAYNCDTCVACSVQRPAEARGSLWRLAQVSLVALQALLLQGRHSSHNCNIMMSRSHIISMKNDALLITDSAE